jgi:hypothetical protein
MTRVRGLHAFTAALFLILGGCKNSPASVANTNSSSPSANVDRPSPDDVNSSKGATNPEIASQSAAPASTPEPAPPAPPPPIVIPSGTPIRVSLITAVGSKTSEAGQKFEASLAEPIVVDDKVVVPKGASATGEVTEAHAAGRFKGAATLDLALTTLFIQGKPHSIQTAVMAEQTKGKGKRTAGMVGGGAGGGALIGGLAGGGKGAGIGAAVGAVTGTLGAAFTGNRDITLPAETELSFKLQNSITVPRKKPKK